MEREKFVDESWKESAELEKEQLETMVGGKKASASASPAKDEPSPQQPQKQDAPEAEDPYEVHFLNYISSVAYQGMIFLGEIPHPVTNEVEKNFEQAKFFIDTLLMLREKTKENLNKREGDLLNASIYELQMKYLELTQKEGAA